MEEITLDKVPRKVRDQYEKSMSALERGNIGYAMDMLSSIVALEPRFLLARKSLRIAQLKQLLASKPTDMTHQLASLKSMFAVMGVQGKIKKDPKAALAGAEKLLAADVLNFPFLKLFAEAADAAEMPEAAVQTLEVVRPHFPKNVDFLRLLAKLYLDTGNPAGARDCYDLVVKLRPGDQAALKQFKDTSAVASMKQGNWEKKGDFREKLKDQEMAKRLEQEHRSVKGEADIDQLIADRLADIKREPQNMNFRRALADLYVRAARYDDALQALDDATKAAGRSDPQIERTCSAIRVKKYDAAIAAAREKGDEAAAAATEQEKADFIYSDAIQMVKRYPNDLQFRYELGVQYYIRSMYNEAIEEFQLAQRNPQRRTRALYYLGLCFKEKGLLDMGFEQLKKAASEITLMDEIKKDVVYEMGILADQMGRKDEAVGYFKEIYAVDIKYRDVAQRIEASYTKGA